MTARSIGSATIRIALVAIPVRLYTAHARHEVTFNRLERETSSRVKQNTVSSVSGRVLESADVVSAFEHAPGEFVTFSAEELRDLEVAAGGDTIEILETVPAASLDPIHVVKSVHLGPDKGGERAYALLATVLEQRGAVAIARQGDRTRDRLLAIRASAGRLVAHELLYVDEVRAVDDIPGADGVALTAREVQLARALVDGRAVERFDPRRHQDGGRARVLAAVERKAAGRQVVVPAPAASPPLSLEEALERSIPAVPSPKRPAMVGAARAKMPRAARAR